MILPPPPNITANEAQPASPSATRQRLERLRSFREVHQRLRTEASRKLERLQQYLLLAPAIEQTLDRLSEELFGQLLQLLQEKLSIALQEVLEQPIRFEAEQKFRDRRAEIDFFVSQNQQREDILRGQGGSVANVLSVGLRMFALATRDPAEHRYFLVLDEPDCWLRPDLVPRLVKIIHDASHALHFQVVLISHHEVSVFEHYADRILELVPSPQGVRVYQRQTQATST